MIVATALELAMLATMLGASDVRTRLLGGLLWCAYFYYSASLCSLRALAKWAHDQDDDPPGGMA